MKIGLFGDRGNGEYYSADFVWDIWCICHVGRYFTSKCHPIWQSCHFVGCEAAQNSKNQWLVLDSHAVWQRNVLWGSGSKPLADTHLPSTHPLELAFLCSFISVNLSEIHLLQSTQGPRKRWSNIIDQDGQTVVIFHDVCMTSSKN